MTPRAALPSADARGARRDRSDRRGPRSRPVAVAVVGHAVALAVLVGWAATLDDERLDDAAVATIGILALVLGGLGVLLQGLPTALEQRRVGALLAAMQGRWVSSAPPVRRRVSGLPRGVPALLWVVAAVLPALVLGMGAGPGPVPALQVAGLAAGADLVGMLLGIGGHWLVTVPLVMLLPTARRLPTASLDVRAGLRRGLGLVVLPVVPLAVATVVALGSPEASRPGRAVGPLVGVLLGTGPGGDTAAAWAARACLLTVVLGALVTLRAARRLPRPSARADAGSAGQ